MARRLKYNIPHTEHCVQTIHYPSILAPDDVLFENLKFNKRYIHFNFSSPTLSFHYGLRKFMSYQIAHTINIKKFINYVHKV